MNSIKKKLFFQIGFLIIFFILLMFLANTFLLEPFYINKSKTLLIDTYDTLNAIDDPSYSKETLVQLSNESQSKFDIHIIDIENNISYDSNTNLYQNQPNQNLPEGFKPPPIDDLKLIKEESINESVKFIWFEDNFSNTTILLLTGTLDNDMIVDLRIPLRSISSNISIINQFILIIGLILFLISMIVAYILSQHFTRPILDILDVTSDIKSLNFNSSCKITTNDELGKLADNINNMSDTLKLTIDDLSEEIDERKRMDEQRKTLLNNVSHELKTPISLVQGYAEGLKINLHKKPEKIDFYCSVIIDESQKMNLLLSELLDINHLQFGEFPLAKEKTNAFEFIMNVIKKYEHQFEIEQINYSSNLSTLDSTLTIDIDALRTEQVLTNLLNNALAYVDDEKLISVNVELKNNSHGTHLRMTIGNSHPFISKQELDKLWGSFYKTDQIRTRENGGYGLGLSIIKAIQEADHNQYGVYSEENHIYFYVDFDIANI